MLPLLDVCAACICPLRPPAGNLSAWGSILWPVDIYHHPLKPDRDEWLELELCSGLVSCGHYSIPAFAGLSRQLAPPETSLCSSGNDVSLLLPSLKNAILERIFKVLTPGSNPPNILS